MSDRFASNADAPFAPSRSLAAITPSDGADLPVFAKAIYVGGAGNIVLRAIDDAGNTTLTGVTAGTIIPVRARRVLATGTTATGLVALL